MINIVKKDTDTFKEKYFSRILDEYKARIMIKKGNIKEACDLLYKCIEKAQEYYQFDDKYVRLLGDYGEILYEKGEYKAALGYFDKAKT